MTFDPKTNRIPYSMLTMEERDALKNCGGPWEYCHPSVCSWHETTGPGWVGDIIYRQAPEPLRDIDPGNKPWNESLVSRPKGV